MILLLENSDFHTVPLQNQSILDLKRFFRKSNIVHFISDNQFDQIYSRTPSASVPAVNDRSQIYRRPLPKLPVPFIHLSNQSNVM
jgi:hypothetical protein